MIHYVALSGEAAGDDDSPTWIQGPRRTVGAETETARDGPDLSVREILVLPTANKALVLCQGVITFYTIPELTPTFTSTKLVNCTWIGAIDQNLDLNGSNSDGVVIMICQKNRLRLVRVGERISRVGELEFGGCLASVRRGDIACVADQNEYSLLDVTEQQRIPLFPIGSALQTAPVDEASPTFLATSGENLGFQTAVTQSKEASISTKTDLEHQAAQASKSLESKNPFSNVAALEAADAPAISIKSTDAEPPSFPVRQSSLELSGTGPPSNRFNSEHTTRSNRDSVEVKPVTHLKSGEIGSFDEQGSLKPVIASPNPFEFLLVTGTSMEEPGLGIFVNTEGDPTPRGTMKFSSFPTSLCVDGTGLDISLDPESTVQPSEGYVLAVVSRQEGGAAMRALQIRRWDLDVADSEDSVHWLSLEPPFHDRAFLRTPSPGSLFKAGCRTASDAIECKAASIIPLLSSSPLKLNPAGASETSIEPSNNSSFRQREDTEVKFYNKLARSKTTLIAWSDDRIWSIARNPLALRMEARLSECFRTEDVFASVDRAAVEAVLNEVRDLEPKTELDFYSLNYIRQKGSVMLFLGFLSSASRGLLAHDRDRRVTTEALIKGDIDPRALLAIIPDLSCEILEESNGIWMPNGLKSILEPAIRYTSRKTNLRLHGESKAQILEAVKDYLLVWRRKKGLASVTDEKDVFPTVDASLIHLMLILDRDSPAGPARKGSIRSELNALIEGGIDCFERAVILLEQFRRLYVLSWLYESRKMPHEVLATWKRIIEGAEDRGGELGDGETKVRRYLSRVDDTGLVKEYGVWLARRNPSLGIRVFADTGSKINFTPKEAVAILKESAPEAVKVLLEHLVFDKKVSKPCESSYAPRSCRFSLQIMPQTSSAIT